MSKEQPSESPETSAKSEVQATDIAVGPHSTLVKAAEQLGSATIREVQEAQARARTKLDDSVELPSEREAILDGMTIEELANEIRVGEEKIAEILGKVAKAQAKVDEVKNYIDGLRRKYELATKRSDAELAVEYLECQKKERIAHFAEALKARGVIKDAGVDHIVDMSALGLGVSPVDRAIAADIQARRYVKNKESRQLPRKV